MPPLVNLVAIRRFFAIQLKVFAAELNQVDTLRLLHKTLVLDCAEYEGRVTQKPQQRQLITECTQKELMVGIDA